MKVHRGNLCMQSKHSLFVEQFPVQQTMQWKPKIAQAENRGTVMHVEGAVWGTTIKLQKQ